MQFYFNICFICQCVSKHFFKKILCITKELACLTFRLTCTKNKSCTYQANNFDNKY